MVRVAMRGRDDCIGCREGLDDLDDLTGDDSPEPISDEEDNTGADAMVLGVPGSSKLSNKDRS